MVTALGHVSGGHFNPAVTIGFWVTKRIGTFQAISYWIAQLLGATAAAYLIKSFFRIQSGGPSRSGTPDLAPDFTRLHGMALEAILTFFLVFVVFATAGDAEGAFSKIAGFAIGLTITMDILFGGPFTGAAMNPARPLARRWRPSLAESRRLLGRPPVRRHPRGFLYDRIFLRDQTTGL